MPADWNAPVNTSPYASVLSMLDGKDRDAITLCDAGDPSNIPTGAKKWNTGTNRLQRWNGSAWVDLAVDVGGGGTGATTAAGARTNLGLGDMATQNSSAVSITGGTIGGTTAIGADRLTSGLVASARLGTGGAGLGQKFLTDGQTFIAGSPIGMGALWFTNVAPGGWLICDGSSLDRTTYADLFAIIGTTYGSVDGTHFNLPDLRQRFPLGKAASGTGNTLAGSGGAIDHTHTSAGHTHSVPALSIGAVGNHFHTVVNIPNSTQQVDNNLSGSFVNVAGQSHTHGATDNSGGHDHGGATGTGTTGSTTPGATGSNNPPYLVVNYIIKYQ
jgi:microcystin-dependent protein